MATILVQILVRLILLATIYASPACGR